ncbi:elongator complex protein 4-like [Panonychus citri]|uniref:elongator complex protein 4-like n=1 Tax=Panonychus citri TaxID=50023 RepID=UPI0023080AF2|nr:elongator complex protein 4-like [Panonychus citri]
MSSFRKFDLNEEPLAVEYIRTGIRGIDQLFGGGLPFNNLILIEEDEFSIYTNLLLKSVSSYVLHGNINLTYFSDNISADVTSFLQKLPARSKADYNSLAGPKDMQIAFRYNHMPSLEMETGIITDFGRTMDERLINSLLFVNDVSVHPINEVFNTLEKLISRSEEHLKCIKVKCSGSSSSQHLIIIDHLSATSSNLTEDNICPFIYQLKSFARKLNKCAIIVTTQSGWLPIVTIKRLRNICDSAIQLEAFDTMKPSVYSDDYKGALHVHKVARISSAKESLVANLGFQLKKNNRYFIVEKLFLPPDIGDTPSRVPTKSSNPTDEIF